MARPRIQGTGFALPDIFDEVEEDLRAERAQSFLRRFGGLLLAGFLAVLGGTGAYVWWTQQRQAATEATADQFLGAAQLAGKSNSALAGIDKDVAGQAAATFARLATTGPAGYQVLARLRLAALQWQLGEHKEAIATWLTVTNDGSAPQLLRDAATITSAQHQVDTANPVTLKQTVEGLTAADNPWRPVAEQIIALIDIRQGKVKEAADIFRRLGTDATAPEGVRQMATDLLTTLPDTSAPASATGAPATAPVAGATATPAAGQASTVTNPTGTTPAGTAPGTPAAAMAAPPGPSAANPAGSLGSTQPASTAATAPPHGKNSHKATGPHKPAPHG